MVGVRWPDGEQVERLFSIDERKFQTMAANRKISVSREEILLEMVSWMMGEILAQRDGQTGHATVEKG